MEKLLKDEFSTDFIEGLTYKTPYFLFSKKIILDKIKKFKDAFPEASIYYAMKANSEEEALETIAEAGCGFEVASKYELDIIKKLDVSPSKILYGTSVKSTDHINVFKEYGVDRFAFDSLVELEKIASISPGAKVYVRASVSDAGSVFKFSEKFGADMENVPHLLTHAKDIGLIPYGISFHVGSQAGNPMAWANAIENIRKPMEELKEKGIEIEVLNIGGGYPAIYTSTENEFGLEEISKNVMKAYNKLPYKPKLILEPGRGIIADSAILVASVIARVERRMGTWLFLDAGVYNALFEAMAYQGSTRYKVKSLRQSFNTGEKLFALAGPTGDSPDIISREVSLPEDISIGDKLIFYKVGAYSLVVTSRFNGFPKPDVYFI